MSDLHRTVTDLARLSLSSAQRVRAMMAVLFLTLRISSSSLVVEKGMEAAKAYGSAAKQIESQDEVFSKIGLPHHHIWNAFVSCAKELADESDQQRIEQYLQRITNLGDMKFDTFQEEVPHVKIVKAFKRERRKLEISVKSDSDSYQVWLIIV